MADISANFLGIKSPNPFWLASAPPTDKQYNVLRAFEAGWGGVVWKTLGSQVKNVSSRYSAVNYNGSRVMGFNNIELISDRPLYLNLREIAECVRLFPDRAMIVSLMADNTKEKWHELIAQVVDHIAIRCMYRDKATLLFYFFHQANHLTVINHQSTFISHKGFERGYALFFYKMFDLVFRVLIKISDGHMKTVVANTIAI